MTVGFAPITREKRPTGDERMQASAPSDYASLAVLVCLGSFAALVQLVKPLRQI